MFPSIRLGSTVSPIITNTADGCCSKLSTYQIFQSSPTAAFAKAFHTVGMVDIWEYRCQSFFGFLSASLFEKKTVYFSDCDTCSPIMRLIWELKYPSWALRTSR